jgi:hypothetical protein
VAIAYVAGFLVMVALLGWHPDPDHRAKTAGAPGAATPAAEMPRAKVLLP